MAMTRVRDIRASGALSRVSFRERTISSNLPKAYDGFAEPESACLEADAPVVRYGSGVRMPTFRLRADCVEKLGAEPKQRCDPRSLEKVLRSDRRRMPAYAAADRQREIEMLRSIASADGQSAASESFNKIRHEQTLASSLEADVSFAIQHIHSRVTVRIPKAYTRSAANIHPIRPTPSFM